MTPQLRHRRRTDANHGGVVAALEAIPGCFVQSLAMVGSGCPDLLVGYREQLLLLEVKDGSKAPSKRRLSPDEREWIARIFAVAQVKVHIVGSAEEAVACVEAVGWLD